MTSQKSYFIVDDDLDDQQFLIEALTENDPDIRCFTALNGKEAIQSLNNKSIPYPYAIFLDLNMPQFNGKQCLAELKRTLKLRDIPVIIYSTSSNQQEIDYTLKMGALFFLIKRTNYQELRQELDKIMILLKELKQNI